MKAPALLKTLKSPVAIAVSGGGDSVALLVLAHDAGLEVTALTVDHALREGSAAEARQVKRWCRQRGIAHVSLTWKHGPITSGLQAKARAARYDLMTRWCLRHDVPSLLTAHTRDDQAETVAMRQRRTASAKSLAAIWPATLWNGVQILRPLLQNTRTELRVFLEACGQPWLEDPSNENQCFERVRVRQSGVPQSLAKAATRAQNDVKAAQARAQRWFKDHVHITPFGMMSFPPRSLAKLPPLARDEALQVLIKAAGGTPPDRASRIAHLAWIESPKAPRRSIGGTLFASRTAVMIAAREPGRIAATPLGLKPRRAMIWDGRFMVSGPKGSTVTSKSMHKELKRNMNIPSFVDQGLPVVSFAGKVIADPFFSDHPQAKITLIAN